MVFRPDSGLAPNAEYRVRCPNPYYLEGADNRREFSFSTGSSSLSKAPPIPNVATVELSAQRGEDWGDSYSALFRKAGDLGNIIVLNLGGSSTLNPDELSGDVADPTYLTTERDYWVGTGPCGGNWPDAALGASTTIALGAFDLAGGFSGWSDTVGVTLPSAYTNVLGEAPSDEDSEPASVPSEGSETPQGVMPRVAMPEVAVAPEVAADDIAPSTPTRTRRGRAGCHFGTSAGSSYGAAALLTALAWRVRRRRPHQPSLGARKSSS